MAHLIRKYLKLLGYDIGNTKGDSCIILNICDFALLLGYIVIATINVLGSRLDQGVNLTYVATAILSCRTLFRFWIKERMLKKAQKGNITLTYTIGILLYLLLTAFFIICYFFISNDELSKLFLILYYCMFFIFELTEIFTRSFDANPHIYKA